MATPVAVTNAVSAFRNAENGALARSATNEESLYTGSGRETPTKTKAKGKKKGIAAIFVIIALFAGGGAFLGSSNSLLAPALEALFTDATDTQYASNTLRTVRLTGFMMKGNATTTNGFTGITKYNHMPNSFKKRLASFNIEVSGSGSNTVLNWNHDGITTPISADDFANMYSTNADFRDAYSSAKRGRVASFFDNIANKIYQKLGLSRNLFSSYKQTGNSDADKSAFDDTMIKKFEGNSSDLTNTIAGEKQATDSEGNLIYNDGPNGEKIPVMEDEILEPGKGTSANKSGTSIDAAETSARSFIGNIAGSIAEVADMGCSILKIGNMISMAVAANEIYQSINYFMGFMENVSKMKAGYGDTSAINEVLNFLSTSQTTEVPNMDKLSASDNIEDGKDKVTGAPLQANGMQLILAGAPANTSTTKNYSLERVSTTLGNVLKMRGMSIAGCAAAQIANGIASDIASIAVTVGGGGIIKIVGGFLIKTAGALAISAAASAILSFAIPAIAQSLFTNVFETATGIPAGELFTKGASAANTRLGRSGSGQSLSSKDAAIAYNQANNTVLAWDAEVDRKNLSPFDITNRNTFLGNIAYSLLPTLVTTKTTAASSFLRTTATSIANITGRVSATGENSSYMTTFGDCPDLNSIGAVGDIYCNPITSTDVSTLDIAPDDSTYTSVLMGKGVVSSNDIITSEIASDNQIIADVTTSSRTATTYASNNTTPGLVCDSDGNCTIQKKSNLAYYISFCSQRDTPFGIADSNILSQFEIGNTFFNSIPIIGDILNVINGIAALDDGVQGWVTGKNCSNSSDNPYWEPEMKYYQRYTEDQRILEQLGVYENGKSPVGAYIEEYEKEHPLDTSRTGIIAHYTGMTKNDAEALVAILDYSDFLNDYDASTRIAMDNEPTPTGDGVAKAFREDLAPDFDQQDNPDQPLIAQHQCIIYADVRNRSYAA